MEKEQTLGDLPIERWFGHRVRVRRVEGLKLPIVGILRHRTGPDEFRIDFPKGMFTRLKLKSLEPWWPGQERGLVLERKKLLAERRGVDPVAQEVPQTLEAELSPEIEMHNEQSLPTTEAPYTTMEVPACAAKPKTFRINGRIVTGVQLGLDVPDGWREAIDDLKSAWAEQEEAEALLAEAKASVSRRLLTLEAIGVALVYADGESQSAPSTKPTATVEKVVGVSAAIRAWLKATSESTPDLQFTRYEALDQIGLDSQSESNQITFAAIARRLGFREVGRRGLKKVYAYGTNREQA